MFMKRKGFEIAISTVVIIVISIILLAGLIFLFTNGFNLWTTSIEPISDSANMGAVKEACNLACSIEDEITFCCNKFSLNDNLILCTNSSLGIDCLMSCSEVSCPA